MKIISFNFNKINIEKNSDKIENLKINTNINISEITKIKQDFLKIKEELIKIKFIYNVDYNPHFAKIELRGDILFAIEQKMAKNILKQWKNKKISGDFKIALFNIILKKSNLRALQLEDEMNLPLHIPLPVIKKQANEEEK